MRRCSKLVTVVTPVHNGAPDIQNAIESVLSQNIEDLEYIIVDDACTDNTLDIIKSFQDDRIKIIHNHGNCGVDFSIYMGYLHAQGKYCLNIPADDFLAQNSLKKRLDFMEQHKDVTILGGAIEVTYANGAKTHNIRPYHDYNVLFLMPFSYIASIIRTEFLDHTGFITNILSRYSNDIEFFAEYIPTD